MELSTEQQRNLWEFAPQVIIKLMPVVQLYKEHRKRQNKKFQELPINEEEKNGTSEKCWGKNVQRV